MQINCSTKNGANLSATKHLPSQYNIISEQRNKQSISILISHQYSSSNENGNAVLREGAKQARNTHRYTFSMLNFTSLKANYRGLQLFAHVIRRDARGHYQQK